MKSLGSEDLQDLCAKHGLLAAILLLQPDPSVWIGNFKQSDYAHLLLVSQTQTLPFSSPRLDAVQLSGQAVLVHSRLINDGTFAMLVFPFEIRMKDLDQRAAAFLNAIETRITRVQSQNLLDGLRARQVEPTDSGNDDLLALFSGMPEADPSNDATQPFRISKISIQTLEKSMNNWKQIF
jgi:hypothetical protein